MPEHQQLQQSKKPDTIFQKQATHVSPTQVSSPYSIIQRARINPKSLTHADIMQLQRTIGNQAVGRLLSSIGNTSTAQQATVQRQEEEPLQGKMTETVQRQEIPEEEEPLQGKMIETVQRQEIPEEEEPLQGKMIGAIQRQEIPEEEEPLQGKMIGTVQRQEIPEEEEPLQGKIAETVQRQEIPEEEEPLQGKFEDKPEIACPSCFADPIVQRQEIPEEEEPLQTKRENNTGMPDNLKAGVENLSGIDMSDVRVHYNSSKPAEVGALAYTQGTNIHVAPGQERHLPHEAWHVVQQAQSRVQPTMQMKDGVMVNDEERLEHEADIMGARTVVVGHLTPHSLFSRDGAGMEHTHSQRQPTSGQREKGPLNFISTLGHAALLDHSPGASSSPPIQRFRLDGQKSPGAYLQGKDETPEEFKQRMNQEMQALRQTMAEKDAQDSGSRSPYDFHGGNSAGPDLPEGPKRVPNPRKVLAVHNLIAHAQSVAPVPTVAISYRSGFGYDTGAFTKGTTKATVKSVPPGRVAPPRREPEHDDPTLYDQRNHRKAGQHLQSVDANGLYIPGGQDIPREGSLEQRTRELYERALIYHARNTGLPTLAICGGSRCLARGFGGREALLSQQEQRVHNPKVLNPDTHKMQGGTEIMAHSLSFPDLHTILGSAADPKGTVAREHLKSSHDLSEILRKVSDPRVTVDMINSTHQKIVAYDRQSSELANVNQLPVTKASELMVSALGPEGYPEGFETRHGAPMLGVTSHPEAIHGAKREARQKAASRTPPQGLEWSDRVFRAFEQSMRTHAARQQVNREIKEQYRQQQPPATATTAAARRVEQAAPTTGEPAPVAPTQKLQQQQTPPPPAPRPLQQGVSWASVAAGLRQQTRQQQQQTPPPPAPTQQQQLGIQPSTTAPQYQHQQQAQQPVSAVRRPKLNIQPPAKQSPEELEREKQRR